MTNSGPARVLHVAAVGSLGLMAGLYWSFSTAVMPGLAPLDDAGFVAAMQHINVAILNPVFGLVFVGGLVLPAVDLALQLRTGRRGAAVLTGAGLLCYAVTLGVTMAVNVPLNDALAAGGSSASAARAAFEAPWNAANLLRSVVGTVGVVLLAAAGCGSAIPRTGARPRRQPTSAGTLG